MSDLKKRVRLKKSAREDGLILTPRVVSWLSKNTDVRPEAGSDIEEEMLRIMRSDANSKREGRFGASSRGNCLRRQLFMYLGMESENWIDWSLANIFFDGHMRHLKYQLMGLHGGFFTHVEWPFADPARRVTVSVDALNEEEGWLFELKGAYKIPDEVPWHHLLQIHTYFLITGYAVCVYLVEEKGSQRIKEWVVRKDPKIMAIIEKELDDLNEAVETEVLPPVKAECEKREGEYKECPYARYCRSQKEWPTDGQWDRDR